MALKDNPFDIIFREMENMRHGLWGSLDDMHQRYMLPAVNGGLLPAIRGQFKVDVRDEGDEVIVIADLPGVDKDKLIVELVNPFTLVIRCDQVVESEDTSREGYYMRERAYGTMQRAIYLPCAVTDEGSTSTFKNGVLEIHLKKTEQPSRIPVNTD
jgi:HSP20 family protein